MPNKTDQNRLSDSTPQDDASRYFGTRATKIKQFNECVNIPWKMDLIFFFFPKPCLNAFENTKDDSKGLFGWGHGWVDEVGPCISHPGPTSDPCFGREIGCPDYLI